MIDTISCGNCPIDGAYDKIYVKCNFSYDQMRWCPMTRRFMGKNVVYVTEKRHDDDALNPDDLMAFWDFDSAAAYVKEKTLDVVCVNRQNEPTTNRFGMPRTPSRVWLPVDSWLFRQEPYSDVLGDMISPDEFDPAFAEDLSLGLDRIDIVRRNIRSPHVKLFYHLGMTRWYERDEIIEEGTARFMLDKHPHLGDGENYGKDVWWGGRYVVVEDDCEKDVEMVGHSYVIRMVAGRVKLTNE